jgi:hypothetical protein
MVKAGEEGVRERNRKERERKEGKKRSMEEKRGT